MKRKNVLWLMSDQQQMRAMGCADPAIYSPNLDAIAEKGVRFTSAISASAQCTPSRATWMTGKFPHQVGVNNIGHTLDPADEVIGRAFQRAGYLTAYVGKWHLGNIPLEAYGYDIADYRTDDIDWTDANRDHPKCYSHSDAIKTAMAVNFLRDLKDRDHEQPFFLTVSWHMPHPNGSEDPPFELIRGFEQRYPIEEMPIPDSFYADDLSTKPAFQRKRSDMEECSMTEAKVRKDAQKYRTMVSHLDRNIGKVLRQLEESGLAENTIILFTSDHGDMQGAHRLRLKGTLPYNELYNVPLLLYIPDVEPKRKVIGDLVSSSSVPATLLDAAGVEVPAAFEGPTLMPLLASEQEDPNRMVFFEHYKAYWGHHPFRGVQTKQWKYVLYYESGEEEMYDLLADPQEMANISGIAGTAETRQQLRTVLDSWWERTGALSRSPLIDPESDWGSPK